MQRLKSWDALKFFAIFLVVWGHSLAWFSSTGGYDINPVNRFIYSFHMPLFMAISGYFSFGVINKSPSEIFSKRAVHLLVPSLTFCILGALETYLIDNGDWIYSLYMGAWFLVSLFLCIALYYITMRNAKFPLLMFLVGLLFSQIIQPICPYSFKINFMYPAFLLGVLIRRNYDTFKDNALKIMIISGSIFLILFIFMPADISDMKFNYHDKSILFDFIYKYTYKMFIGLVGATFFIAVFDVFAKIVPNSSVGDVVCKWGQETLGIYLISGVLLNSILSRFLSFNDGTSYLYTFIITPALSILTIVACIYIIKLLRLNSLLRLLCLGERSPK